jgi:hypothetical protein
MRFVVRSIIEHRPIISVRKGQGDDATITEYGPTVWKIMTDQNFSFIAEKRPDLNVGDILEVRKVDGESHG